MGMYQGMLLDFILIKKVEIDRCYRGVSCNFPYRIIKANLESFNQMTRF